jgi:acyl dehydratase
MPEEIFYYEDLEVGRQFLSPGRTITEADIVNFAGLSGDYNQLHTDAEYSKNTMFGERVAHGMLGLVITSGLYNRTELSAKSNKSLMALLGVNSWKFMGPIKIGDTLHLVVEVAEKRETSKPDRGIVVFRRKLVNQRGETVQEGEMPMMIRRKPS